MKKIMMSAIALSAIMGSASTVSAADGINVLDGVKLNGQIRPRYEYADVDNNDKDAGQALTTRIKLNASSNLFGVDGLNANVGLIGVYDTGWTSENGFMNGGQNDKIVDPSAAMLSNLEATYTIDKTTLHAGRGQVNLDNQRFIGTVGWRQLERSYDTLFVANNSVKDLNLLAAWVYGFEGVAGTATNDTNSILLHGSYKAMDALTVTAYAYMLASINDTYGVAATGKFNAVDTKFNYRAEFAMQSDATMEIHDAEANADAMYMNFDLGANISGILLGANYEFQSGADGSDTAFITPLGTNHKFNGWADAFLSNTSHNNGLIDMNARVGYKAKGFGKVLGVFHKFDADTGSNTDLGSEFDALYANKIPGLNNVTGLVKMAYYMAGETGSGHEQDITKAWVQLNYKF